MFPHASRQSITTRPLFGTMVVLSALGAFACSQGASPTAPSPLATMPSAAAAKAAPLAPDQASGRHGGGGGGGSQALSFEIRPDVWNTNYVHSGGFVEAFLIGKGASGVDPSTITLSGDSASATPLAPVSTQLSGNHLLARFPKADAFALLDNPKAGDTKTLTISFTAGGKSMQLTATVRVVGPGSGGGGGSGSLALRIAPDVWNIHFANSEGTVAFFITGADVASIDLSSIRLTGDNAAAVALSPVSVKRVGHQVVARFDQEDAIASLTSAKAGESHTLTLSFTVKGTATTLTGTVRIVGH